MASNSPVTLSAFMTQLSYATTYLMKTMKIGKITTRMDRQEGLAKVQQTVQQTNCPSAMISGIQHGIVQSVAIGISLRNQITRLGSSPMCTLMLLLWTCYSLPACLFSRSLIKTVTPPSSVQFAKTTLFLVSWMSTSQLTPTPRRSCSNLTTSTKKAHKPSTFSELTQLVIDTEFLT